MRAHRPIGLRWQDDCRNTEIPGDRFVLADPTSGASNHLECIITRAHPTHTLFTRQTAMTILILGLVIFLGTHSIRIFADDWRAAQRTRTGEGAWKLGYSLASIIGFGLIIWGFEMARHDPIVV